MHCKARSLGLWQQQYSLNCVTLPLLVVTGLILHLSHFQHMYVLAGSAMLAVLLWVVYQYPLTPSALYVQLSCNTP